MERSLEETKVSNNGEISTPKISFFGARKIAMQALSDLVNTKKELYASQEETKKTKFEYYSIRKQLEELGAASLLEIQQKVEEEKKVLLVVQNDIDKKLEESIKIKSDIQEEINSLNKNIEKIKNDLVVTEETAILQEVGIYEYRHPLSDAASYEDILKEINELTKMYNKNREAAISAAVGWTVNGSASQGAKMVADFSKLMLLAFNAEADTLVRGLKPYKLEKSIERLKKVAVTISKLGKTMSISVTDNYLKLRIKELEVTADFIDKQAKEKEAAREEKARLQEERKAQAELERERQRLEKEKQHYQNALLALKAKGDEEGVQRIEHHLEDVEKALSDVDYRSANIRAGYVYVISNVGAFGESMVKIGMTRRLEPMDRINELGDASVPFKFDVHALFFSKDAVTIESEMHSRLASKRVNKINLRREFFNCTPLEAKSHLSVLAGELLEFSDSPEAIEYRQSLHHVVASENAAP